MIDVPHSALLRAIFGHAVSTPDKTALVVGAERVSYSRLLSLTCGAAAYLRTLGLKTGDYILLSAQKEVEFVYLYLAAHLLGVINVVVDAASPRSRLEYIMGIIKPQVVFGNDIGIDTCRCVSFNDIALKEVTSVEVPSILPTDVADVMFTTGTTGAPKGVCLSHDNISGSASNTNAFIGNGADDVEALALPLSHSFGLGRMRCVLSVGATLVLIGNFANLKSFFTVLENEKVTGFGMVPAVWQYIKRISGSRIGKFANQLRYIEIGSAPLPVEDKRLLMELFPKTRLCMHYGLTEASRALFTEFHNATDLDSVGVPSSAQVEVCVLDEEGRAVADGTDGEICVRGNMVSCSYFLQEDNKNAYWGEWFRTGDWGHRDSNGYFYLTGRKKELINVGGEKVSPVIIEKAILSLCINDCACVAVPDPKGVLGEVPKAYLVKGSSALEIEDIKARLAALLLPHEIPVEWEWVEQIPRTSSGKVQRLKLKS